MLRQHQQHWPSPASAEQPVLAALVTLGLVAVRALLWLIVYPLGTLQAHMSLQASATSSPQRPPPTDGYGDPSGNGGCNLADSAEESPKQFTRRLTCTPMDTIYALRAQEKARTNQAVRAKDEASIWKKLSGELEWYGSSDDDEPPSTVPFEPPQPQAQAWRIKLGASRVAMWLGLDSWGGESHHKGSLCGRQKLLDEWHAPRKRVTTGRPNPRLERGKQWEPRAREQFASVAGLELGVDITKASLAAHPEHPYIAARADGLIGANGVLEIKTPWAARTDEDAPLALEPKHLLQVHTQLECTDRDYAIVVMTAVDDAWLHVWKIHRDCPEYHCITHGEQMLWQTALPEYQKYAQAVINGGQLDRVSGGITAAKQNEIRCALGRWQRQAVFKLQLAAPTPEVRIGPIPSARFSGWTHACSESNNRPSFTLIDGVGTVASKLCVRRFTRVWWRYEHPDAEEPEVYLPDPYEPFTSGGYIRPQYYHATLERHSLRDRELWLS